MVNLGNRNGKLVVIERLEKKGHEYNYLCQCDCGKLKIVNGGNVPRTKSCGCLENRGNLRHGHARYGQTTKTYYRWYTMRNRCRNQRAVKYSDYGGRGVTICDGWYDSYESFLMDMGEAPPNKTLERKNNDFGYWCGHCDECVEKGREANCRWATPIEQANNRRTSRRIVFNGESLTVTQLARLKGVSHRTLFSRLYRGASVEELLENLP